MKTKGVIWICWGSPNIQNLEKSVSSALKFGLSTCIISDGNQTDLPKVDHYIKYSPMHFSSQDRVEQLLEHSIFDLCVHLDSDTIIIEDPSFGFEMAEKHGIALSIAPASFASRWHEMPEEYPTDLIQYNCGVIFYDSKSEIIRRLFLKWKENIERPLSRMQCQDQPAFAAAIYELGINPCILPKNWNFRPDYGDENCFGPIIIWHSSKKFPDHLVKKKNFWSLNDSATGWKYDEYSEEQRSDREKVFNHGLARFIGSKFKVKSVLEFGCGMGLYLKYLEKNFSINELYGIEPHPPFVQDQKRQLIAIDITQNGIPLYLIRKFDLVYSIEVLEHIEEKYHMDIIRYLCISSKKWLIFSAAQPGQEGVGHISCKELDYWEKLIENNGFSLSKIKTKQIRDACDAKNLNHRKNLMVFKTKHNLF